jgi:hypothetical protein
MPACDATAALNLARADTALLASAMGYIAITRF